MIDKDRVKIELNALKPVCDEVRSDLNEGWVELHGITFPSGWRPRTGALRFELQDPYPGSQPKAFIPENMRYKGGRPHIMLRSGPPGWRKYCIHRLELDAGFDTLVSMTRLIEKSLLRPHSKNPVKKASRR
ncbi:hypothetical protein [Halorarum salinum]|uniref:Uncharacterized protein n=1 Tax=Halorarum salinum TaxID=2743089 RepID=A0A7D5QK69_9EURY|nr:hypothetical protein [Halobaculum salinum]QLG61945.1 hypothetical protein HUG12_09530 [Halobaculum salinum]